MDEKDRNGERNETEAGRFASLEYDELENLLFDIAATLYEREMWTIRNLQQEEAELLKKHGINGANVRDMEESVRWEYLLLQERMERIRTEHDNRWYRADGIYADIFNAATGNCGRGEAMEVLGRKRQYDDK